MVKTFFFKMTLIFWLFSGLSIAAEASESFTLNVDKTEIEVGESIRLDYVFEGQATSRNPDFSPLKKHFDILDFQPSSSRVVINGKATSTERWTIYIRPKQKGRWLIPPISYQGLSSPSYDIVVNEKGTMSKSQDVFLETHIDKSQAYIDEQIHLVFKLYFANTLSGVSREAFNIPDATITEISGTQSQERINGKLYQVQEYRYIIQSKKDGTLVVPQLAWQFKLPRSGSRSLFDHFGRQEILSQKSDEKLVRIKKIPDSFPQNEPWLPLKAFTLEQEWSADISQIAPGEPVTRTIKMEALGTTSDRLPVLVADEATDKLKVFAETPQYHDEQNENGLLASSTQSAAVILSRGSNITFGETRVPWWNLDTDQLEFATLSAVTLQAKAQAASQFNDPRPLSSMASKGDPESPTATLQAPKPVSKSSAGVSNSLTMILTLSNLLSWCLIAFLLFKLKNTSAAIDKQATSTEPSATELLKLLKQAEQSENYSLCYQTVITLVREHFDCSNLDQFRALCLSQNQHEVVLQINELENTLYSPKGGKTGPNSGTKPQIYASLKSLLQTVTQKREVKRDLLQFHP